MQEKIQKSYGLCGYLDKKSPSLLKAWQKRYFRVGDAGSMLLYYQKDPHGNDTKPQGILPIMSMVKISAIATSKVEFIMLVNDREFHVRAQNEQSRFNWIETLTFLRELKLKQEKEQTLSLIDLSFTDSSNKINTGSESSRNHNTRVDWSDLDKDTMNRIKLEDEKVKYTKAEQKIDEKNEEVLRAKCIYPFLAKYDQQLINRHVICGFLVKKGSISKLSMKKRWFFMISSVVINGEKESDQRINQSDLPAVFKLDSIYYFAYDSKGDKSNFTGKIFLDDCEKPELMSLDKINIFQALPFGFTLYNKKDFRQFNLYSKHLTEVNKWVNAIQAVHARPNKNIPRGSKLLNAPGQINDQEEEVQFLEEMVIYESKVNKKHHNKLLTGPLSWRIVTLQLKQNIVAWNAKNKDKDENTNQYILLINILKVEGARRSWVIFTKDGEEYKFKAESEEQKDEWVKQIQDQVVSSKGNFNDEDLRDTVDKDESQNKAKQDSDGDDDVTKTYYKMMEIAMNKNQKKNNYDDGQKKQSFLSKLFCCFYDSPNMDQTDRGF